MRLRQVALVATRLAPVVEDLRAALGIEVGYRDPAVGVFGLENAVFPVGDTFLEVVSPVREGTTAGRFLERRGGDGGYMVIVQTGDLGAAHSRVAALGVRVVWQTTLDDIATIHLHPRDVGGAILSIDAAEPPEAWRWGGPAWREHVRTDVVTGIVGVEIEAREPAAMAARWADVLGLARESAAVRVEPTGAALRLDGGEIRFAPETSGRGEGISVVDLRARAPERALETARGRGLETRAGNVLICGTRLRLVP